MVKMPQRYWLLTIWLSVWVGIVGRLLAHGLPDDSLTLETIDSRIGHFEQEGPPDSVTHYYRLRAAFFRGQDELAGWLNSYWDLQYYFFDDPRRALQYLDEGVGGQWRQPVTTEEWESLIYMYTSQGYHRFRIGEVLSSIRAYERADAIYSRQPLPDFDIVEYVYKPLGSYYTMLGDNEKARYVYEKTLTIAFPVGNPEVLSGLYNNIGLTYWNEGDNERAVREYQKGLSLANVPVDKEGLLRTSLARSYLESGQLNDAGIQAQQAVALLTSRAGNQDLARYLSGAFLQRGVFFREQGRYDRAWSDLRQALDYAIQAFQTENHRYAAKIYVELGQLARVSGALDAAIDYFNRALSCVVPEFHPQKPTDQPSPAGFHEENAIFEALDGKADALQSLFMNSGDESLLEAALACHDLAFQAEGHLWDALQSESAKLLLQSQRRIRTGKAIQICYQRYQQTGRNEYLRKAWAIAERSRASLLREAVYENLARQELATGDSLLAKEGELRRLYALHDKEHLLAQDEETKRRNLIQKNQILDQLAGLERLIDNRYPGFSKVRQSTEFDYKALRQAVGVGQQEILIEYFDGGDHFFVFSVDADGEAPLLFRLPKSGDLEVALGDFFEILRSRETISNDRDGYLALAHELYQRLVGPILDREPGRPRALLIVPDGLLSYLPFEALTDAPFNGSWEKVPFLIRRYRFRYAYSADILSRQLNNSGKFAGGSLLAVAPGFDGRERGLPPLPFSGEEVSAISLRGAACLVGGEATRQAFLDRASDYRILHFSTHARADSAGRPPCIEFIDQPLYLPEIYALDLRADLVTLSACETGLGRLASGEGVMSLSRGFAYAGATNLVASLWTVNAGSTSRLMASFYQAIASGMPKATALHNAKLFYLDHPDIPGFQKSPYYWAGFVYYGNDSGVTLQGNPPWWQGGLVLFLFATLAIGVMVLARRKRRTI